MNNNYETKFIGRFKSKSIPNDDNYKPKKSYFSNKNTFEYIWLTPSFEYLVNIKTPEISFYLNDMTINKKVDSSSKSWIENLWSSSRWLSRIFWTSDFTPDNCSGDIIYYV